ncbi:MAG: septum formation inhibitor Maf [Gammaproteobacteria bacterium]|nr:septum formation inhibitor Maf [Gammaproteobacteria bacterium]
MPTNRSISDSVSPELLLASASPRRQELLRQIGVRFRIVNHGIDESRLDGEAPRNFVRRMAREKAHSALSATAADRQPIVLGADTIVVCDDQVLGKPGDRTDAVRMLTVLSGREHRVFSAVAVAAGERMEQILVETVVEFTDINREMIDRYWDTGEPQDKAGAYGIQGLGGIFVKYIRGSYTGVVGLPLFETAVLLNSFGIPCWGPVAVELDWEQ